MEDRQQFKIFNDSVHGTITLHPLLVKIIDTPEFQRLRDIKQLGGVYRVYPAAAHNRFEHSIGVSYLAGVFVEALRDKQKELNISSTDVLCVKIAGLCHDIGHGPFSHVFDQEFQRLTGRRWRHEELSAKMLFYLYEQEGGLKDSFEIYGLSEHHLRFICGLIDVQQRELHEGKSEFIPSREFLYEIVSSKTGLDVDRWDYFARDCLQLGLGYNFDHRRCIELARVTGGRICFRDKEAVNIYNMFVTRYNLFRCAYCHPTTMAVQMMIAEALYKADNFLRFEGLSGTVKLSESVEDMKAYSQVTDSIYYEILRRSCPKPLTEEDEKVDEAKALLKRIERHDFYILVGKTASIGAEFENENLINDVGTKIKEQAILPPETLIVKIVNMGFGGIGKYPLEHIWFYTKNHPDKPRPMKEQELPAPILTQSSQDKHIRVYSKTKCEYERKVAFNEWLNRCFSPDFIQGRMQAIYSAHSGTE